MILLEEALHLKILLPIIWITLPHLISLGLVSLGQALCMMQFIKFFSNLSLS
jgi:hypothetical protein